MKNCKTKFTFVVAALAGALTLWGSPAHAQAEEAAAVAAPIVVKTIEAMKPKPNPKGEWVKGQVIHADAHSIVFREEANGMMIHTFTIDASLKDKMQAIVDNGGYQYGDHVKVLHAPGQTVALRIHGKPSKPS